MFRWLVAVLAVLFCNLSLSSSLQETFDVSRIVPNAGSSERIQSSADTFKNMDDSATKSCLLYRMSFCVDLTCNYCRCYKDYNFFSLKEGCISIAQIYYKSAIQGGTCQFRFSIYASRMAVPTLIDAGDFYSFPKQIDWSPFLISPPFPLQSSVNNVHCTTGKLSYFDSDGNMLTFYNNTAVDAFEVQGTSVSTSWFTSARSYLHQLRWNQPGTVLWDQMRGRLMQLSITCQQASPTFVVSSCILLKISGKHVEVVHRPIPTTETLVPVTRSPNTLSPSTSSVNVTNSTLGIAKKSKGSFPGMTLAIGITAGLILLAVLVIVFFVIKNRNRKRHSGGNVSTLPTSKNVSTASDHKTEPNGVEMYSQRCYEEIVEIQPILEKHAQDENIYDNHVNVTKARPEEETVFHEYAACGEETKIINPASPDHAEVYTDMSNPYYKSSDEPARTDLESENPLYTPSGEDASPPMTMSPQYEDISSGNPLYVPMA